MSAKKKICPSKTPMPEQDAVARSKNFTEVSLGYTKEQALLEASRCLHCKKPTCVAGCPVEIDIPGFIAKLLDDDIAGSYEILRRTTTLPAVCGRVCPQEIQCEGACILGKKYEPVAIGRLERYVADTFASLPQAQDACQQLTGLNTCAVKNKAKVACIGSGPSSLACAGTLAAQGVQVTVFEALHEAGGVLVYGIPEFRLPKNIVRREIQAMRELGVRFELNQVGGKIFTLSELLAQDYDAVFIGVGAGLPRFMGIAGENLLGVFSANEYLTRVNLGRAYDFPVHDTPVSRPEKVCVIGGGNVAMDAARTARRLGAEVTILYRRTEHEMPARLEEVHHAKEEGIQIQCLCSPVTLNGNEQGKLVSVTVQEMCLGEPDESGRCRPICVEGAVSEIPTDMAIIAVGTRANPVLLEATPELELNKWGYIVTDETGATNLPMVFAGGDIVTGAATVISAMGAGRKAALSMLKKL